MSRLIRGGIAGFMSTIPMSVFMAAYFRTLAKKDQYPLPPSTIIKRVEQEVGLGETLSGPPHQALTVASHFAYGAACGSLYGALNPKGSRVLKGSLFGLFVWAVSYLGYLPALRLSKSAVEMPRNRNILMIGAHLIYGTFLSGIFDAIREAHPKQSADTSQRGRTRHKRLRP